MYANTAKTVDQTSNDNFVNINGFHATYYNDIFYTDTDGYVFMRSGDDKVFVEGSNVTVFAGSGNDEIYGSNGSSINLQYFDDTYDNNNGLGAASSGISLKFTFMISYFFERLLLRKFPKNPEYPVINTFINFLLFIIKFKVYAFIFFYF